MSISSHYLSHSDPTQALDMCWKLDDITKAKTWMTKSRLIGSPGEDTTGLEQSEGATGSSTDMFDAHALERGDDAWSGLVLAGGVTESAKATRSPAVDVALFAHRQRVRGVRLALAQRTGHLTDVLDTDHQGRKLTHLLVSDTQLSGLVLSPCIEIACSCDEETRRPHSIVTKILPSGTIGREGDHRHTRYRGEQRDLQSTIAWRSPKVHVTLELRGQFFGCEHGHQHNRLMRIVSFLMSMDDCVQSWLWKGSSRNRQNETDLWIVRVGDGENRFQLAQSLLQHTGTEERAQVKDLDHRVCVQCVLRHLKQQILVNVHLCRAGYSVGVGETRNKSGSHLIQGTCGIANIVR
mmetsp:Transcript_41855/g.105564  ORF Transcript_41855/g.105564 Transcript_41855/m.105564 type:complete len:351 (+) Transcript_41855:795-1847(+)